MKAELKKELAKKEEPRILARNLAVELSEEQVRRVSGAGTDYGSYDSTWSNHDFRLK